MPAIKLTNAAVVAAEFEPKPYELRDTILSNFYIRVTASKIDPKTGSKIFKVDQQTVDGKRRPATIGKFPGMSVTAARAEAKAKLQGEVIEGTRVHSKASNPTLEELAADWVKAKKPTHKVAEIQAARTLRVWGKKTRAADITVDQVRAKQLEIAERTSNSTANRAVTNLRAIMTFAIECGIRTDNPAKMTNKPKNGEIRRLPETSDGDGAQLYFTEAQVERMRGHLSKVPVWFQDLFEVALGSGARRGELLSLNWRNVDLQRGAITVLSALAKSKTTRRIPLTKRAAEVLRQRAKRVGSEGLVWGDAPHASRAQVYMDRLLELAKIEKPDVHAGEGRLSFHTLRATFASHMVQKGASLYMVSKILGHSSPAVTEKHYGHLSPESLESAVALLD